MSNLILNGEQTFLDNDGNPLVGGKVYFYVPDTSTPKDTFQDSGETILNTNPVILDAGGRAVIWGTGAYRQVLTDSLDNEIWDRYVTDGSFIPDGSITLSKIQSIAANTVLGAVSAGSPTQLPMTAAGRNIVAAANVLAQQTLLNLVPGDDSGQVVKWSGDSRNLAVEVISSGNGSTTVPSISFTGDLDTGFSNLSSGFIHVINNGVDMWQFTPTGLFMKPGNNPGTQVCVQAKDDGTIVCSSNNVPSRFWGIPVSSSLLRFYSDNNERGSINVTGAGTQYTSVSDYRLKQNIKTIDNASGLVLQLKPCEFTFKSDENNEKIFGFIAHEVQEIAPFAVSGEKDGDEYQQLDSSKLIGLLTAALQDAIKRIEALENNGK